MVTIRDVAKEAGVAISTVSKVLNSYPNVSEDTKKKVNDAIAKLHFVPNTIAAALSSKRTGRVALIMNLITQTQAIDEIDMQYLSGAIYQAGECKMDVIPIFFSMIENMSLQELITYLHRQNVEGIIIYGLTKNEDVLHALIASGHYKCVVIDAPISNEHTSSVWIDQAQAQYEVAKAAMQGSDVHSVFYIAGKENGYVTEGRTEGIKRLCEEFGLELRIECGNFSELTARGLTLRYGKNYDLIACASDLMAIGAMNALVEMDIYHPVCGFDGITLMGYVGKRMYTVRQDFYRISCEAVKEMERLSSGEPGRVVVLPHSLVRMRYEDIIC